MQVKNIPSYKCNLIQEVVGIRFIYEEISGIGDDHPEPVLVAVSCTKEMTCQNLINCPLENVKL